MLRQTTLEVNTNHVLYNLSYFRSQIKPQTKIMVMVKAFAYGLGNPEMSKVLESANVDYLGVAYTHEGVELRKAGINKPIMVMNPHPELLDVVQEYDLEPEVYSLKMLEAVKDYTSTHNTVCRVHLKVETGMNRLGIEKKDLPHFLQVLKANKAIKVAGILSHLSSAEMEEERDFTLQQIKEFDTLSTMISQELGIDPIRHLLNSAGAVNFTEHQFDMIRLGIGIFGVDRASKERPSPLKTTCTFKSYIAQIRQLEKGQSVGYSRAGKISKDNTRIAIIGMGYADGFYRSLGNGRGSVWINGHEAPTIGNICMDMFMVDITGIPAEEGDEVEIFGDNQPVEKLSEYANTIPYEVFTSIGERVARVFV